MKKIGLICLALVLALGALGMGYALWWDQITIVGSVETGTVNVEIIDQKSNDPTGAGNLDPAGGHMPLGDGVWGGFQFNNEPPIPSSEWYWLSTTYDKDVASCDCIFGPDWLRATMFNVYPSYGPDVAFSVQNLGTVPVNIVGITLLEVTTPEGTFPVGMPVDSRGNSEVYMVANNGAVVIYNGPFEPGFDDDYAFTLMLTSLFGMPLVDVQIDPEMSVFADVGIHVAQSAMQSQMYSFTLGFTFGQWNEGNNG
ncbi:MAG: hypothetical protein OEV57_03470 [Dehalococcoidia bacterium]|nr:hypothetical protein [Dehalococcoidia bacterium]